MSDAIEVIKSSPKESGPISRPNAVIEHIVDDHNSRLFITYGVPRNGQLGCRGDREVVSMVQYHIVAAATTLVPTSTGLHARFGD